MVIKNIPIPIPTNPCCRIMPNYTGGYVFKSEKKIQVASGKVENVNMTYPMIKPVR